MENNALKHAMSDRLKQTRKHFGRSQKEMDPLLGIGKNSWQRYESGGQLPGSQVIAKLVVRGIDANWLLTGNGEILSKTLESTGIGEQTTHYAEGKEAAFTRLRQVSDTLKQLEAEADWQPPLSWHELIKTLMYTHGLDAEGAARLLEAIQSHLDANEPSFTGSGESE
jgi:DNA-binding XRE family transcriptional regulator